METEWRVGRTQRATILESALSRRALVGRLAAAGALAGSGWSNRPNGATAAAGQTTAADPAGATTEPHRFGLGAFSCVVVNDGPYAVPAAFVAVNAPPAELAEVLREQGLPTDLFGTVQNTLLVDTGRHLVLIDTGAANAFPDSGKLLPGLRAVGVDPADIDVVVLTHAHIDHVGGAIDAACEPAFPNARYVMGKTEWDFWLAEPNLAELPLDPAFRESFRLGALAHLRPLEDRIDLIADDAEIVPGIRAIAAPGHTPGHLAIMVSSGSDRLLHVVDIAADPALHLAHPDWFLAPDNWPAQAMITRRLLLDQAAADRLLVLAYHFPFPGLGHVTQDGDGWLWQPVGSVG